MDLINVNSTELEMLRLNKEGGYNYRERRQQDWRENYSLYRDKVTINRLTQRQSVNIPLMKGSIKTLLKDIDDMPVILFENRDNDKEAQVFQNEYWKHTLKINNASLMDIVDKRQCLMFGRTFKQIQIVDGKIKITVIDPQDILVGRFTDPLNVHSSRFLIHTHIFKTLSEIEANEDYDKEAVKQLKLFYQTEGGLEKASDNLRMLEEKNQKMADMGVSDVQDPVLGETYVELSQHFIYRNKDNDGKEIEDQLFMYVEADDQQQLMKKPLEEVIGKTKSGYWKNHLPYNTWAEELEKQDFWTDGTADILRGPNKVLNSWYSQMVENRTLKNFGMTFYDSTVEGFSPNTFNAQPWGFYPFPGDPRKGLMRVEIDDLANSLPEIDFLIRMAEKGSGATSTQQGEIQQSKVTLGEIELALTNAKERVKGMSKFYTPAWEELAEMFLMMIEAGADKLDAVKIYKEGRNTKDVYEREITPSNWMTKSGYSVKIWSQDEKDVNDNNTLQKLSGAKTIMPNNAKVDEVYKRKYLEFAGFTPDEVTEAMDQERLMREAMVDQANQDQVNPDQQLNGGQAGNELQVDPNQLQQQPTPNPVA